MHVAVDLSPFGTHRPGAIDRAVIGVTRRLPAGWFGARTGILLRRLTTTRTGAGALDVTVHGVNLRLYPRGNICEKGMLFTPQLFEPEERRLLEGEIARARAEGRTFRFVDGGANVGLYALLVARMAGQARVLAIEPQPGVIDRLAFNIGANPGLDVRPVGVALAERDGEAEFFIDPRNLGESRIGGRGEGVSVTVRTRRLLDLLVEEGFAGSDVLKLDVEGTEELVLEPYLAEAPDDALPRLVIVEDNSAVWTRDLAAMLARRGFAAAGRGHQNLFYRRG